MSLQRLLAPKRVKRSSRKPKAQLSLPSQGCVFSLNGQVVPRSEWQHTKLNSGD
ncbi:MoaD/ThiS family protein, partial [Vibrio cholerae]|uniref:MoaD/ThiS family protein n=1 Tax=Vibrio cholerae TaxID=666 RepID=UPI00398EC993